jgi:hypothetical protein
MRSKGPSGMVADIDLMVDDDGMVLRHHTLHARKHAKCKRTHARTHCMGTAPTRHGFLSLSSRSPLASPSFTPGLAIARGSCPCALLQADTLVPSRGVLFVLGVLPSLLVRSLPLPNLVRLLLAIQRLHLE